MDGLFEDGVPTPTCLPQLAELSRPLSDASQLVDMAEKVAMAFVESLQMRDIPPCDGFAEELYKECGLREPYAVDNDPAIWKALGWMGLSVAQWTAIAKHWENGRLNHHAMSPPFSIKLTSAAPIVMMVAPRKRNVLTVSRPPSHPRLAFQIGDGVLDSSVLLKFDTMVAIKTKNMQDVLPYLEPDLILVYGVAYYRDDCQWSSWEMREVQMRSERELNSRIFLQFLGGRFSAFYAPLS